MLSERHATWIEDTRKIGCETAAAIGIVSQGPNIGFEYRRDGIVLYTKFRSEDKTRWGIAPSGVKLVAAFNRDCLLEPPAPNDLLIITEGEFDAAACKEAGYQYVISTPSGATEFRTEGDIDVATDDRFRWLWEDEKLIQQFNRVVLWTDSDKPGLILRDELVVRLGATKCLAVAGVEGCKDANDVLRNKGPDAVRAAVTKAAPLVPDALTGLFDVPDRGMIITQSTGWVNMDNHLVLTRPEFVVVTGKPGSGKSQWLRALGARLSFQATGGGWRGMWLTPEDPARRLKRDFYRFVQTKFGESSDPAVHDRYRAMINDRIKVVEPSDETAMTMDWLKFQIEAGATRHGVQYCVVDPWNEVEHDTKGETETKYIGDAIIALKRIAKRFNLVLFIVAHPSKPKEHGQRPTLYDISGCYSDDTEVLTKRGWLRHSLISHSDEVACLGPDSGNVEWHQPSRIIRKTWDGAMHQYEGYGIDLLVTPDHRMLVKPAWDDPVGTQRTTGRGRPPRWEKSWTFCRSEDLPSAQFKIPLAGNAVDGDEPERILGCPSDAFMELLGWYVSEGCHQSLGISISQGVGDYALQISDAIDRCGLTATGRINEPGTGGTIECATWYIGRKRQPEVVDWIRQECGRDAGTKRIPDIVFDLSPRLKRVFLASYLKGDGSRRREGWVACTTSIELRDQLQRLAVELGIPTNAYSRPRAKDHHRDTYYVGLGRPERVTSSLRVRRHRKTQHYTGTVWCLTVPTGAYFVRRNGRVAACGNSAHWYNKCDHGIVIDRNGDDTTVYIDKSKDWEVLGTPGKVRQRFQRQAADFVTVVGED